MSAQKLNELQDNIEAAIELANTYSTSEIQIGTWLGKHLYRKVFDVGVLPSSHAKTIATGFSQIKVTKLYGIKYSSFNMSANIFPYNNGTVLNTIDLYMDNAGNIVIIPNDDLSGFKAYVIVEYIKTTD